MASATELADLIPTEFGGLSHLFGGEASPTQYEPVNPSLEIPGGSVRGRLGGLVPDFVNTSTHAVQSAEKPAATTLAPVSATARDYVTRARKFLGL